MAIELRRCILPGAALEFVCASAAGRGLLAADWLETGPGGSSSAGSQGSLPAPFRDAIARAARRASGAPVQPPFDPLDFLQDASCWRPPAEVPPGSDHSRMVWRALCRIPVGETRTYGDIAREIGSSAQAVGQACRANPWPLFIPCHRVVPAGNATAGGYSGQRQGPLAEVKAWLLAHEASCVRSAAPSR
jgi:methylated-DNA-[protein]-cysteine S-methyltransferase